MNTLTSLFQSRNNPIFNWIIFGAHILLFLFGLSLTLIVVFASFRNLEFVMRNLLDNIFTTGIGMTFALISGTALAGVRNQVTMFAIGTCVGLIFFTAFNAVFQIYPMYFPLTPGAWALSLLAIIGALLLPSGE